MKKLNLFILLLLEIQISTAQTLVVPALKIYLQDAETGTGITKARVCLEGLNIKSIKAKFSKSGNYYYFNEIPAGYNTIMAYHKDYNEKGYQNPGGLPDKVQLRLHTPYRIRISADTLNYYKEDNSKMLIEFYGKFEDSLIQTHGTADLSGYFAKQYPELILKQKEHYNLGLKPFYYVVKKSKKHFKRFNDASLKKLLEDKNVHAVSGLLLKTEVNYPSLKIHKVYFDRRGKPNYIPKYINDYRDGRLIRAHALKKTALDSLYRSEEKKYKANEFYEFEGTNDTLVHSFNSGPYMPNAEFHEIPYAALSNLMKEESRPQQSQSGVLFSFTYKFIITEEEKRNFTSNYNLEKTETYPAYYKAKYLICSPFGLADVLELTADPSRALTQEIVKNIYKN